MDPPAPIWLVSWNMVKKLASRVFLRFHVVQLVGWGSFLLWYRGSLLRLFPLQAGAAHGHRLAVGIVPQPQPGPKTWGG